MIHTVRPYIASALLAGTTLSSAATLAQDGAKGANLPGDIVVTAQRRETSLLETPITLDAFSADRLDESGIINIRDLQLITPGLVATDNSNGGTPFIRGVGTSIQPTGADTSVAMYLDGVYLPRPQQLGIDLVDVERVEVLKGPQGTLYGRNATGGAIAIVTAKPKNELGGYVSGSVGNYEYYQLEGALNVPIVADRLLARIAAQRTSDEGYVRNLAPAPAPRRFSDQDNWYVRGSLRALLSDTLTADISIDYSNRSPLGTAPSAVSLERAQLNGSPQLGILFGGNPGNLEDLTVYNNYAGGIDYEEVGARIAFEYEPSDDITITLFGSRRRMEADAGVDTDGTETDINRGDQQAISKQSNAELLVNWEASDRLTLTAGATYFQENLDEANQIQIFTGAPRVLTFDIDLVTKSYGGFLQGRFDITDKLSFTAGARYSKDKKRFVTDFANLPGPVPDGTIGASSGFDDITPRFVLEYEATGATYLYASATKGFKSGGINTASVILGVIPQPMGPPQFVATNEQPFDPEKIWSYEAGIKTRLFDGRAILSLSGFYYDWKDLQVSTITPASSVAVIENAAAAEVYGLEASLTASPIDGLRLQLGGALIHSEFTEGVLSDFTGVMQSIVGRRVTRSPKVNINASAEYDIPAGGFLLTPRAEVAYKSAYTFAELNYPDARQEGFALVNMRLTLKESEESRWSLAAFANNLFDERYRTNYLITTSGDSVEWFGRPRTYGLSGRLEF